MAHEYLEGPRSEGRFEDEWPLEDGDGATGSVSRSSLPHWTEPPTGEIPVHFNFRTDSAAPPEVLDLTSVDQGALNWLHERRKIENNNGTGDVAREVFDLGSSRRGRHFVDAKRSRENIIDLDEASELPSGRHFAVEKKRKVRVVTSSNLQPQIAVDDELVESSNREEFFAKSPVSYRTSNSNLPFDASNEPGEVAGEAFSDILRSKAADSPSSFRFSNSSTSSSEGSSPEHSTTRDSSNSFGFSGISKSSKRSGKAERKPREVSPEGITDDTPPVYETPKRRSMGAVATRVVTGLALGALVVVCFLVSPIAVLILLSAAVAISTGEFLSMVRDRRVVITPDGKKSVETTINPAHFIAIPASVAVIWFAYYHGASSVIYITTISLISLMLWYTFGVVKGEVILNVAVNFFSIVWIGVGASFVAMIMKAQPGSKVGMAYAMSLLLATVSADTFAYFGGRIAGRHKLAPDISPGKTVEGYLIGLVGSVAVGALISARIHPMTVTLGVVFGAVAGLIGPVGDLIESKVKRELGAKDAGSILPGHGGFLDRIDSLIFVAPIIYFILFFSHHIRTFF